MANFDETYENLIPQLKAVIASSSSLKNNSKFKKILEVIYLILFSKIFIYHLIRLYLLLEII